MRTPTRRSERARRSSPSDRRTGESSPSAPTVRPPRRISPPTRRPIARPPWITAPSTGASSNTRHARRRARRREQRLIEQPPPLAERDRRSPVGVRREAGLGRHAEAVVTHGRERTSADRGAQPEAFQHGDARGHDSLAARLLAREPLRFVDLDRQTRAPEQQRQRGARRSSARDYDVGHGRLSREAMGKGRKRGLCSNARRYASSAISTDSSRAMRRCRIAACNRAPAIAVR